MGNLKRKIFLQLALIILAFIIGILIAPLVRETAYQIKSWVGKEKFQAPVEKVVILYFSTPEGEELIPVKRKIWMEKESSINNEIKKVIEELIKGPESDSFIPTVPPETKVKAIYTRGDTIYVDFSASLVEKHPGGTSGELVTVYSIVNTLLENFPRYSKVQLLIEGSSHHTLAGHIDIRNPLSRNEGLIKSLER